MKTLFKCALVLTLPLAFLTACSTSTKSQAKSDKTVASSKKKEEFKPEDTSNKTIRQIKTYGDYLIMAKKIYEDGYAGYEEKSAKIEAFDKDFKKIVDEVHDSDKKTLITDPEAEYADKKDEEISAKDRDKLIKGLYNKREFITQQMKIVDDMAELSSK